MVTRTLGTALPEVGRLQTRTVAADPGRVDRPFGGSGVVRAHCAISATRARRSDADDPHDLDEDEEDDQRPRTAIRRPWRCAARRARRRRTPARRGWPAGSRSVYGGPPRAGGPRSSDDRGNGHARSRRPRRGRRSGPRSRRPAPLPTRSGRRLATTPRPVERPDGTRSGRGSWRAGAGAWPWTRWASRGVETGLDGRRAEDTIGPPGWSAVQDRLLDSDDHPEVSPIDLNALVNPKIGLVRSSAPGRRRVVAIVVAVLLWRRVARLERTSRAPDPGRRRAEPRERPRGTSRQGAGRLTCRGRPGSADLDARDERPEARSSGSASSATTRSRRPAATRASPSPCSTRTTTGSSSAASTPGPGRGCTPRR